MTADLVEEVVCRWCCSKLTPYVLFNSPLLSLLPEHTPHFKLWNHKLNGHLSVSMAVADTIHQHFLLGTLPCFPWGCSYCFSSDVVINVFLANCSSSCYSFTEAFLWLQGSALCFFFLLTLRSKKLYVFPITSVKRTLHPASGLASLLSSLVSPLQMLVRHFFWYPSTLFPHTQHFHKMNSSFHSPLPCFLRHHIHCQLFFVMSHLPRSPPLPSSPPTLMSRPLCFFSFLGFPTSFTLWPGIWKLSASLSVPALSRPSESSCLLQEEILNLFLQYPLSDLTC